MNSDALEILLKELLEETQKTNNHLVSQYTELEEIKEKISRTANDTLNADSLSERLGTIHLACQNMSKQLTYPFEEMRQLKRSFDLHVGQLLKPAQQIKHYHHLHKGLIATAVFVIVSMILLFVLFRTTQKLNDYRAGDIKYRHLQLLNTGRLGRIIYLTDSIYDLNPDSLQKDVIKKELDKKRRAELILKANEKQEEARQLRKQALAK